MDARSPTLPRTGTIRVSPATTRETTLRERVKSCSADSVSMSPPPLFVFRNMASRRETALLFKLRLWQKLCCKQSSIGGRYWVGYHREWFLTMDKIRVYAFHLGGRV